MPTQARRVARILGGIVWLACAVLLVRRATLLAWLLAAAHRDHGGTGRVGRFLPASFFVVVRTSIASG